MESLVGKKVKIDWKNIDKSSMRIPAGTVIDENKEYTVIRDIILDKKKLVGVEVDSGSMGFLYALRLDEIIIVGE